MKIAAIVITFNDYYKLSEWEEHHIKYKDDLYLHIVVDNGSQAEYIQKVEKIFSDSVIIKRKSNGGCTGAYNDGLRYALSDSSVDAIMLIGNDIRLESGGVKKLYEFLMSNEDYGMVAPILLSKNTEIIEDYGCDVSKYLYLKPLDEGECIDEVKTHIKETDAVTGGMNMAKREFYESVGFQDEKLFMYSDEVDMAIRAKKCEYKMAVTKEIKAWHQHINPSGAILRIPLASYLIGRNKIYLGWKHFGFSKALLIFFYQLWRFIYGLPYALSGKSNFKNHIYFLLGTINGISKNMNLYRSN